MDFSGSKIGDDILVGKMLPVVLVLIVFMFVVCMAIAVKVIKNQRKNETDPVSFRIFESVFTDFKFRNILKIFQL